MGDMLSQDEINALLKGMDDEEESADNSSEKSDEQASQDESLSEEATDKETTDKEVTDKEVTDKVEIKVDGNSRFTSEELDAVGEISNISMGTAATTLSSILNQKVNITTPKVEVSSWEELLDNYEKPLVAVQIVYKEGLEGNNVLFLNEEDVKIITDLMMGGDGTNVDDELGELHLSAISEAMNQMVGSSSTSLSQMFDKKIDIAPPISKQVLHDDSMAYDSLAEFLQGNFLRVSFRLIIGDLIDSELMQLYPFAFVDEISENFMSYKEEKMPKEEKPKEQNQAPSPAVTSSPPPVQQVAPSPPPVQNNRTVDVQRAEFESFQTGIPTTDRSNIDLIMDVPLSVTVELGRTSRSIKDILDFAPGTIIELDKIAGEPIDVLVNGKIVAKGEVVVIAENFSIRLTEIMKEETNINLV